MTAIVFPVANQEPHAVLVDGSLNNTLAAVGNLLRDHGVYGPMSPDFRDQADQLAETAMQIVAIAEATPDTSEGVVLRFTSLGNTPQQDVHYTAIVNDQFRALMGAVVNLINTGVEYGTKSEEFALAGIAVVVAAEPVLIQATPTTSEGRTPMPALTNWMLHLNEIRQALEAEGHEMTEHLREIVSAMSQVAQASPKVLVVIERRKVSVLCATAPVTVVIVDKDGTERYDQSDRITLRQGTDAVIESDEGFEARVLAAGVRSRASRVIDASANDGN